MADAYVQLQPDSTGKKVDTSELTVNGQSVERQRIVIGDPVTGNALVPVIGSLPNENSNGLVVREAAQGQDTMANSRPVVIASDQSAVKVSDGGGSLTVDGSVSISGTPTVDIGTPTVNIGTMPSVALSGTPSVSLSGTSTVNSKTQDGSGNAVGSTSGALDVNVKSSGLGDPAETIPGTTAPLKYLFVGGVTADAVPQYQPLPLSKSGLAVSVAPTAVVSGGALPYKLISAATTNATSVKGSAGQVYGIQIANTATSARFLKLYDKASAPTVGTDTPVKTLIIPGVASGGVGANYTFEVGIQFSNGIAFAITSGMVDSDTGAVGANEVMVNVDYK